jgi:hypothetical protein
MQDVDAVTLTDSDGESEVEEEEADYKDFAPRESSPERHGFIWENLIDSIHGPRADPDNEDEDEDDEERLFRILVG